MKVLGGVDEEYSWEALRHRQIHQFPHAIPDCLELTDVERNVVSYALHVASGDSVIARNAYAVLVGVVDMVVDEIVDDCLWACSGVNRNRGRLIVEH